MDIVTPFDRTTKQMDPRGEPYRYRKSAILRSKKKKNDIPYNLLRTCKQVCREATPIMYTSNSFDFWGPEALLAFMVRFPGAVPHLRKIRVSLKIDTRGC